MSLEQRLENLRACLATIAERPSAEELQLRKDLSGLILRYDIVRESARLALMADDRMKKEDAETTT